MIIGLFVIASGAASRAEAQAVLRAQGEASVDALANLEVRMAAGVRTDTQAGSEAGATMSAFGDSMFDRQANYMCKCRKGTSCDHAGEEPRALNRAKTDSCCAAHYHNSEAVTVLHGGHAVPAEKKYPLQVLSSVCTTWLAAPALMYAEVSSSTKVNEEDVLNFEAIITAAQNGADSPAPVYGEITEHIMNVNWAPPGATTKELQVLADGFSKAGLTKAGLSRLTKGLMSALKKGAEPVWRNDDAANLLSFDENVWSAEAEVKPVQRYEVMAGCSCSGGENYFGDVQEYGDEEFVASVPVPSLPADEHCKCGANVMAIFEDETQSSPMIQEVGRYSHANRHTDDGVWIED